jgi:orotate phosphoribosyltransferase
LTKVSLRFILYNTITRNLKGMKTLDINTMLHKSGAMLTGHFLLSSGLHSGQYLQCALLLSYPGYASVLCRKLAHRFQKDKIDLVIGPAYGGIIVAYELARLVNARAIFTERKNSLMQMRRGFSINKGQRVLIAEDVVTTGRSVKDVIKAIRPYRPEIIGVAALIDRSSRRHVFGKIPFRSVKRINITTYTPGRCPLCRDNIQLVKPGSRVF